LKRELEEILLKFGINPKTIECHRRNVRSYLQSQSTRFFPIIDTCRLDNHGIRALPECSSDHENIKVIAFTPAAGASSRYVAPLADTVAALETKSIARCQEALKSIRDSELSQSPLPQSLKILLHVDLDANSGKFNELADRALSEILAPKALYPAVSSGETFLEIKRLEHLAIGALSGEIYVTPPGQTIAFKKTAERVSSPISAQFYEQNRSLATIRFNSQADYLRESDSQPSFVPGGHGALIKLFAQVKDDFVGASGIFIRNIDNISGTSERVLAPTLNFLNAFKTTLHKLNEIRSYVRRDDLDSASMKSRELAEFWRLKINSVENPLICVMRDLFHSTVTSALDLRQSVERPFVLMGQVPNTGKDVGGSCVFTNVDGVEQKLCLELPHASPDDRKSFLENPDRATHFNPVFVAAEIPDRAWIAKTEDHPFWLISKKSWKGQDVYYQESILYEILGSSQYTNVIFAEVPRVVFNPHKTLLDAKGKKLKDWIG
jgi:hypothetical protein